MIKLSPAPSPAISPSTTQSSPSTLSSSPPSKLPVDFSPPLISMVAIVATAFVSITYSRLISSRFLHLRRRFRRWRRLRRRRLIRSNIPSSAGDIESPPYNSATFDPIDVLQMFSPYGLDDSYIKTIPFSIYTRKSNVHECAVCLLEFEENDYVRTLPACTHAFHVDCIDIWLRSHANCPLCRTGIFRLSSPFIPDRPSLDEAMIESAVLETLTESPPENELAIGEIAQEPSP